MTVRIGTGAGFSSDRLAPALTLIEEGQLDYIIFECVGERTLAFGHRDRMADPTKGYNKQLEARMRGVLPLAVKHGTRVVTNMGVANPSMAAERTVAIARALGLDGLKVTYIDGDEVSDRIGPDTEVPEIQGRVKDVGKPVVGANAYIGADALLPALEAGADVVITGRCADPSLFLAPLRYHYGWAGDDWARMGAGTLVGHLMECGMQITGGYFADPGRKDVADLANCGFPIAEVEADGSAVITKLDSAGGLVDTRTVKEQLLYEVHNPEAYLTPDVTADFSQTHIDQSAKNRVRVSEATGRQRPDLLKVTLAFDGGVLAEGGISYAGPGASTRARLAADILEVRMREVHGLQEKIRCDLIGVQSVLATAKRDDRPESEDVRLHVAMRTDEKERAENLLWEIESLLCCGPAGGGGFRGHIQAAVHTESAYLPRADVPTSFTMLTA
ncbi:MAG: acyclic terpene utilization AtuA family protein [Alphaproteobacteria bacterium]|nr:acyclic terpene utilization AtuA family protein [Alphaproteobacteria bacterium]